MFNMFSSMFSASDYKPYGYTREFEESLLIHDNLEVNGIRTLSTYCANGNESDRFCRAKTAPNILNGDTLLIFISSYDIPTQLPYGFKKILSATDENDGMNLICGYKVWNTNDPISYRLNLMSETFISMTTFRGTRFVINAKGRINASCSSDEILCPRLITAKNGAVLSAYSFDEPNNAFIKIEDQKSLSYMQSFDGKGLAVGISPSDGGRSKRLKAVSNSMCGGGDDIAFSIAIH